MYVELALLCVRHLASANFGSSIECILELARTDFYFGLLRARLDGAERLLDMFDAQRAKQTGSVDAFDTLSVFEMTIGV